MNKLTKQDIKFVEKVVETGEQTLAAKEAYGITNDNYAKVKGYRQARKPEIQNAIQSIAERVPDDKLHEVLMEGLEAMKPTSGTGGMAIGFKGGEVDSVGHQDMFMPDYAVRHKYLDTALKLKGEYPTDSSQPNLNILMPVLVKFLESKDDETNDS